MSSTSQMIPFDIALNAYQNNIINKPYRGNAVGRTFHYFKDNKSEIKNLMLPFKSNIGNTALFTSVIGVSAESLHLADIFSHIEVCPTPELVKTGIILGLAVFESVIICYNLQEICSSNSYLLWTQQYIKITEDATIVEFLKTDDILKHLLCPISGKIPKIPATLKNSNIAYDYVEAVQWINNHVGQSLPGTNVIVKESDFIFDFTHINAVIERLDKLGTLLHEKKLQKFSNLLGKKFTSENEMSPDLKSILVAINFCVLNNYISIEETILGNNPFFRKSWEHIHHIDRHITHLYFPLITKRSLECEKELCKLKEIWISRMDTQENMKSFMRATLNFHEKASYIKTINIVEQSGFVKLYYNFFNFKQIVIVRRHSRKLKEELFGDKTVFNK